MILACLSASTRWCNKKELHRKIYELFLVALYKQYTVQLVCHLERYFGQLVVLARYPLRGNHQCLICMKYRIIRVHTKSWISNSRTFKNILGGKQICSRTFPARHPHILFTILSTEPFRPVKQSRSQKLVLQKM